MERDDDKPVARRVRMRRTGRGAFSGGGAAQSTRSEGMRTAAEHDEVDEAIDPEAVVTRVRARAPVSRSVPGSDIVGSRLNEIDEFGNAAYSREHRMNLMHRMLLRRMPLDQIAKALGISIHTAQKDRQELKGRLREVAKELDINEMVGNNTGLYDELSGMALRIASNTTGENATPIPMQLAAMRTALAANADKSRFYQASGVFDVLRFRRTADGTDLSDIQLIMQRTGQLLEQLANPLPDDGFAFSDGDDAEVMEL